MAEGTAGALDEPVLLPPAVELTGELVVERTLDVVVAPVEGLLSDVDSKELEGVPVEAVERAAELKETEVGEAPVALVEVMEIARLDVEPVVEVGIPPVEVLLSGTELEELQLESDGDVVVLIDVAGTEAEVDRAVVSPTLVELEL